MPIAQIVGVLYSGRKPWGGPVDIPGDQLRTIVERIEHIEQEISELNEGKREIYQEAKGNGLDPKILREIVRLRKQDQKEREEHESLLELYLKAINGVRAAKRAA
jgi:uncharacterized protein (UPF0335 family)